MKVWFDLIYVGDSAAGFFPKLGGELLCFGTFDVVYNDILQFGRLVLRFVRENWDGEDIDLKE